MACEEVEPELVAYHFGVVDDATRARIEAHLIGCSACVRAFVETKRAIELGEREEAPAPSPRARARLRRAVAREVRGVGEERPWAWWERPVAFGFAASMVAAAMVAVHAIAAQPGSPPYALREHGARGESVAPRR